MKKVLSIIAIMAIVATTVFVACKKGNDVTTAINPSSSLARKVDVTTEVNKDYGFLMFNNNEDLEAYKKQIVGNTHGEVREYLNSIKFNSLGKTVYESFADETEVTEEQSTLYLLNAAGVVEVKDVVMKQLNQNESQENWHFFLTMNVDKLSLQNYESLSNGIFKPELMNKFACGQEVEGGLFSFIGEHPFGYEATTAQAGVKFWGWNNIDIRTGPCKGNTNCICKYYTQRYTVFWTWTGDEREVEKETGICS